MIVTSLAISGTLVIVRDAADNRPPALRLFVGMTVLGVGLATMAGPWPQMAGGLAALVALSTAFVYGAPAFKALGIATTAENRPGSGTQYPIAQPNPNRPQGPIYV